MNPIFQKRTNNIFYGILGCVVLVTTIILGLFHRLWWYFIIGVALACITHLCMLLQSKRFLRIQRDKYEKAVFAPKKDAIVWIIIRVLIIAVVMVGVGFLAHTFSPNQMLEVVLLFLVGYTIIKGAFIAMLFIFKEGR